MFNGHHLCDLIERDHITLSDLVKKMNWSSNRQYYQFVEGNPTAKTLELISDFFNVSVDYFFDREKENLETPSKLPDSLSSRHLYERLLEEKDKRILTMEKLLALYEKDSSGTKQSL